MPRRTSHFEENASEVIFDGSRTKNYEVSTICGTYEIRVQSYNVRTIQIVQPLQIGLFY